MERRLFSRSPIEVDGELSWTTKRLGRTKTHSIHIKTLDLSVDGARVLTDESHDLSPRRPCRLGFRHVESDATVLSVEPAPHGRSVIRLSLQHPSPEFLEAVEHWLPTEFPDERPVVRPDWAGI